jgi:L-ascorbate metabolism protein UlaG (beta-lactamase superfamily)
MSSTRSDLPLRVGRLTYIGGPTSLIEMGGLRLLTDPTFDDAGSDHPSPTGAYTLVKTLPPAIRPDQLGHIDAVLLSHDHHADNLDHAGAAMLAHAGHVLTTRAGAARLGAPSIGLDPWNSVSLPAPDGLVLRVTATPARHGPVGGDRGPVIGFVLEPSGAPDHAVYVTGDTVWYEGVEEAARRFEVRSVVAFFGAARVAAAGPSHLTLTGGEGVLLARAFPKAAIVPVHFEGWAHFSEGRTEIVAAFAAAGLEHRLRWPIAGAGIELSPAPEGSWSDRR